MIWLALFLKVFLLFTASANALFTDEAFVVDWHKQALGTLSPSRILFSPSSLTTFSDSSILASIDPSNGHILWRHYLDSYIAQDSILARLDASTVLLAAASASDPAVTRVAGFVEQSGGLIWQTNFAIGAPLSVTTASRDIFILASDGIVVRLRHLSGRVAWQFSLDEGYSPVAIAHIEKTSSITLIVRSQAAGFGILSIDSDTGALRGSFIALDSDPAALNVQVFDELLAWSLPGTPQTIKIASLADSTVRGSITASHAYSSFEGVSNGGLAVAFSDIKTSSSWLQLYELSTLKHLKTVQLDLPVATLVQDKLYEVSASSITTRSLAQLSTLSEQQFPTESELEFAKCSSTACLLGYTNGEYSYVTTAGLAWTRDESTVGGVATLVVDLEEEGEETALGNVLLEEHASPLEAYVHRLIRHIVALSDLPTYLLGFFKRFISGNYDAVAEQGGDRFGFRKFIVLATTRGGLRALDSLTGDAAWKADNVFSGEKIVGLAIKEEQLNKNIFVVGAFGSLATFTVHGDLVSTAKLDALALGDKVDKVFSVPLSEDEEALAVWTAHGDLHFLSTAPTKPLFFSKVVGDSVKGYLYNVSFYFSSLRMCSANCFRTL